jgi:hypothetical protein
LPLVYAEIHSPYPSPWAATDGTLGTVPQVSLGFKGGHVDDEAVLNILFEEAVVGFVDLLGMTSTSAVML